MGAFVFLEWMGGWIIRSMDTKTVDLGLVERDISYGL
jgi:hypothetical protein